jgi:hypothetical protein
MQIQMVAPLRTVNDQAMVTMLATWCNLNRIHMIAGQNQPDLISMTFIGDNEAVRKLQQYLKNR